MEQLPPTENEATDLYRLTKFQLSCRIPVRFRSVSHRGRGCALPVSVYVDVRGLLLRHVDRCGTVTGSRLKLPTP